MPAKTVIQTFRTQVAVHEVGMDFLIDDLNNESEVDLNGAEFARYEAVKKKLPADAICIFHFHVGVNYLQAQWTTEGVLIKALLILNPTQDEIWIKQVLTEI
jgi:hypothetical protein